MKHQLTLTLALAGSAALLLAGCATKISSDKDAPTGPPSATVQVEETQASYWGSAEGGQGTINYQGKTHAFSIHGVGVGGSGLQTITATGDVYNLDSLSDFPGTYTGPRSGYTLLKGKMHAKLTNDKGVILYLTGHTQGIASSTGADTIEIKIK